MKRKIESIIYRDARGCGCYECGHTTTGRHYGEYIPLLGTDGTVIATCGFTGWRGPYCSQACYRLHYPEAPDAVALS